jgi:HAD superfamily hydrolase (TIGR01509 family)
VAEDLAARYALRTANEGDVAAVAACVHAAYRHYVERIGRPPGPMTDDYADVIRARQVTVAESAGRIVGVLVLALTEEGFLLENVAVDPSRRGTGLGRTLLELAEAEARRAGFDSIYLYTHEKMSENRALYSKIGYAEYDRRFEKGLARVYMRKALRAVAAGKVVMFDLGGVLVENAGAAGLAAMLPAPLEPAELWRRWLDSPSVRAFERGRTAPEEFAAAFIGEWRLALEPAAFLEAFAGWPRGLYEGADALLRELKGRHRLACLSNTNALHWQRLGTLRTMLDACFVSHETGFVKPDREAFEHALGRLGAAPSEVYFFDDLLPNVEVAREIGINAFRVAGFAEIAPILRGERLLGREEEG